MVFLFPQPSESELASFYGKTYYGENRQKFLSPVQIGVDLLTRWKWRKLHALLNRGDRFLDIGCGRGTLLQRARAGGIEAYGIERPSPVGHSVPGVLYQSLPECHFPDNHFHVVVLWHVLEHLEDPAATLREIQRILRPGGWLSIAVPNYGGAQAEASGPDWFHLDLPRHFWHFRLSSLQPLLSDHGFQLFRSTTFSLEYDWFGTLQSWMNRWLHDNGRFYSLLQGAAKPGASQLSRELAAATVLALPALASALWDAARGQGGTLGVTARKIAPGTGNG